MRRRLLAVLGVVAVILAVIVLLKVAPVGVAGQTPAATGSATRTAWGDPDLQGIWTDEFQTPLQRQATYAGKELFTEQERANWTTSDRGLVDTTAWKSTEPYAPARTTPCSVNQAPGNELRWSSIRQMD